MRLIFLLMFICSTHTESNNSNETKYIDLLPDEEKQAFLDIIARRIFSEIQTKDEPYESMKEISNKELNKHNEYVNKVIREESDNLRRTRTDETDINKNDTISLTEDEQTRPLVSDKTLIQVEDEFDKDHIDLTFRQRSRKKRNGSVDNINKELGSNYNGTISSKPKYDGDVTKINHNQDYDNVNSVNDINVGSSVIPLKKSNVDESDIQVRGFKRHFRNSSSTSIVPTILNTTDFLATQIINSSSKDSTEFDKSQVIQEGITSYDTVENETSNLVTTKYYESDEIKTEESTLVDGFSQKVLNTFENGETERSVNTSESKERPLENVSVVDQKIYLNNTQIAPQLPIHVTVDESLNSNSNNKNVTLLRRFNNVTYDTNDITTAQDFITTQHSTARNNLEENTILPLVLKGKGTANEEVHNTQADKDNIEINYSSNENDTLKVVSKENNPEHNFKLQELQTTLNNSVLPNNVTTSTISNLDLNITQEIYTTKRALEIIRNGDTAIPRPTTLKIEDDIKTTTDNINNKTLTTENNNDEIKGITAITPTTESIKNISYLNDHLTSVKSELVSESNTNNFIFDKNDKIDNANILNNNENKIIVHYVDKITKMLREGMQTDSDESIEDNSINKHLDIKLKTNKIKKYSVYEIPADETPFLHNNHDQDQPFYVPIYNYSPNNAYFNSYNKLGPNNEDVNNDAIIKNVNENKRYVDMFFDANSYESKINYDDNRKFRFHVKESNNAIKKRKEKTYQISSPLVDTKPKTEKIYFNSDDYLDADYYFGRIAKKGYRKRTKKNNSHNREYTKALFPRSSEEQHLYQNIKNENGNLLRAIRKILFQNKIFGYVPSIDNRATLIAVKSKTDSVKPKIYLRTKLSRNGKVKSLPDKKYRTLDDDSEDPSDIAMDYYFGRLNLDDDTDEKTMKNWLRSVRVGNMQDKSHTEKRPKSNINSIKYNKIVHGNDEVLAITPHPNTFNDRVITIPKLQCFRSKKGKKRLNCKPNEREINRNDIIIMKYITANDKGSVEYSISGDYFSTETEEEIKNEREKLNSIEVNEKQDVNNDNDNEESSETMENNRNGYIESLIIKHIVDKANKKHKLENVDRFRESNTSITRTSNREMDAYVEVMKDLLETDSELLERYDWLSTTVNIQSALDKLITLTVRLQNGKNIYPEDLELLKYIVFLHKLAKNSIPQPENVNLRAEKKEKRFKLPRNRKQKKSKLLNKGLIDRVWLYRFREKSSEDDVHLDDDIGDFSDFLYNLSIAFNDLHEAINHIALITPFKKQRWYTNLKELYLSDLDRKKILEVILHLFTTKLLDFIENSASNGLEDNFLVYVQKNAKEVDITRKEFVNVLSFLDEMKKIE